MKATQAWYNICNIRNGIVILSEAKNLARWTVRFFASLRMTIKNRLGTWKSAYNLRHEREPGTFYEVFTKATHSGAMIARRLTRLQGGSTWKSKRFIMATSQKAHLVFWTQRKI